MRETSPSNSENSPDLAAPTVGSGAQRTVGSRRRTIVFALVVQALVMVAGMTLLYRGVTSRIADEHMVSVASTGILWFSICVAALTLLTTGWTTMRLMRRHDQELVAINTGLESEITRRVDQALAFRDALILGLTKLADYRDTDTGTHLERIAEYSEILARRLAASAPHIDEAYIRRLRVASAMHDIGKVGVEDAILLKPGKLTDEERTHMQRHPLIGADTLLAIRDRLGSDELVEMSIVVALEHHERWDGEGYPLKLSGDQIQLPARIVALADVYDALTSERVYKPARSHADAAAMIISGRGTQFDPVVVDAFLATIQEFDAARARLQKGAEPRLRPGI